MKGTMVKLKDKRVFIVWAPYSPRSKALAEELGMDLRLIHYLKFQRPFYAPFKYALQALHTVLLLLKERPRIVFVQDPPIFASLAVYIYTVLVFGQAQFVVDAHTGAFLHPYWKPFRWLQKWLYRRALVVITTNRTLTERVLSWRAEGVALAGPPLELPPGKAASLGDEFNVVLINSFSVDEPLDDALEGAARLPDVHLYVTGDVRKATSSLLEKKPPNVTFTGFLPDQQYLELLRGTDAIMSLTSEDHTLQLGGLEAVAVGKPLITSDVSFLREHFNQGTVHVSNDPNGVSQGIAQVQRDFGRLSQEMVALRHAHQQEWLSTSQHLRNLIGV
jgi:glycosyltransferase involved in cell wall biosynthesis